MIKVFCNKYGKELKVGDHRKVEMARSSIDFFSCPYNIPGDPPYSYCDCEISEKFNHNCINCTKHWLESEAEE